MRVMGRNFMKAEGVTRQRNIDILSVRPAGILPADREQQAKCLFGAQAESLCSEMRLRLQCRGA